MLAKKFKVAESRRIKHIFVKGKRIRSQYLQIKYLPNEKGFARFAVIVTKKFSKRAVDRNTVKRRLYDALRNNWEFCGKKCYDAVVMCSPSAAKIEPSEISKDLISLVKKL